MKLKLLLIILLIASFMLAQQIQFGEGEQNSEDGPYIFWNKSDVTIQYFLDGSLVTDTKPKQEGQFLLKLPGFDQEFEITSYPYPIPKVDYYNASKIFAVSDIHGQFDRFKKLLLNNGIIDEKTDWNWKDGHLVILGDVFDRGDKVTEALWLIHKLERQAAYQNGKVHLLLGNHEIMILQNDLRYVHDKYKKIAETMKKDYSELFSPNSELGKWLRSRNTIEVINSNVYVHGGISDKLLKLNMSFKDINKAVRENLKTSEPENSFEAEVIFGSSGPFWFRGYFAGNKKVEQMRQFEFFSLLENLDAERMIVGHTTQDFINPFFNDRLIPIDSGIKYGNKGEALLWKEGKFYRAKSDGYKEQLIFP